LLFLILIALFHDRLVPATQQATGDG